MDHAAAGVTVLSRIAAAHPHVTKAWVDAGYRTTVIDHGAASASTSTARIADAAALAILSSLIAPTLYGLAEDQARRVLLPSPTSGLPTGGTAVADSLFLLVPMASCVVAVVLAGGRRSVHRPPPTCCRLA